MRTIEVTRPGGPEAMRLVEVPTPVPGPTDLLVEVAMAGVNFIDVYHRQGVYPLPAPVRPGQEGSGTVVAVGAEVTGFVPGDRVAWALVPGSYPERVVVPESAALSIPTGIDLTTAAAVTVQGLTAHFLVNSTYPVRLGDIALVHAAAGGVGLLLTRLVKERGARVIGTVSTEEKARLARDNGADDVIRYTETDLVRAVAELAPGGVHVVYDGVGAATFDAGLAVLRPRGTLVLFGAASGPVPPVDPQRLNAAGSLFLTRPSLLHHIADRAELSWRAEEVFDAVLSGVLTPRIGGVFPLSRAGAAHELLEARRSAGKLLLDVTG